MEATPGFSGLKITNYYRYIIYISGVILVLSIFVPAQGLDNERIRNIAFWVTLGGLLIWFLWDIIYKILQHVDNSDYDQFAPYLIGGHYFIQIVVWAIVYYKFFG